MDKKHNHAEIKKLDFQKKVISAIFIALLVVQMVMFYGVTSLGNDLSSNANNIEQMGPKIADVFIADTVRVQLRYMLSSTRQGWVQYLQNNPNIELIKKIDNKIVYGNPNGDSVAYDPITMERRKCDDTYYDIYQKGTGKIIAKDVKPMWNEDVIKEIISVVAAPLKGFGSTGYPIIYDAYTGEIIEGDSGHIKETPKTILENGKRSVKLLWLHTNCKNPEASKKFIEEQLMLRRDTDSSSNLTWLFSEPNIKNMDDANDFSKYPLGQYNRIFVERIILPYETVSVEGEEEMQISIVVSAAEQELVSGYKTVKQSYEDIKTNTNVSIEKSVIYPFFSVLISLIIIFFAMFMLRLNAYQCKVSLEGRDCKKQQ